MCFTKKTYSNAATNARKEQMNENRTKKTQNDTQPQHRKILINCIFFACFIDSFISRVQMCVQFFASSCSFLNKNMFSFGSAHKRQRELKKNTHMCNCYSEFTYSVLIICDAYVLANNRIYFSFLCVSYEGAWHLQEWKTERSREREGGKREGLSQFKERSGGFFNRQTHCARARAFANCIPNDEICVWRVRQKLEQLYEYPPAKWKERQKRWCWLFYPSVHNPIKIPSSYNSLCTRYIQDLWQSSN